MSLFFKFYLVAWILVCLAATVVFLRHWRSMSICRVSYWRFLLKPWKLITFGVAALGQMVMAPYTCDPTWDWVDAGFMSVMTFATAPWAVGVFYGVIRGRAPLFVGFVAGAMWMFSASWSYDLYILLRNGSYPATWSSNIVLSSMLYCSAGLLWNLDWLRHRGVHLAFTEPGWPEPNPAPVFRRIAWLTIPFMLLAAAMLLPFLWL